MGKVYRLGAWGSWTMKGSRILRAFACLVLVIFLVSVGMPVAPVQADPGSANFSIVPATTSVQQNVIFTVDIRVDASSQPVDAAQAYLNFDPNYLIVVDANGNETNQVINGELYNAVWPDVLSNTANNSIGQINYAAGKGTTGSVANTLFTLATIRFQAIARVPAPGTAIIFNSSVSRATRAVHGLDAVTGSLTGGTVIIIASSQPRGRRSLPDPSTLAMVSSGLAAALLYIGLSRLRRRFSRS